MTVMTARGGRRRSHKRVTAGRPGQRVGRPRRSMTGARAERSDTRRIFLPRATQQVSRRSPVADWLAGGAMLTAAASWGLLASLLSG